MQKVIKSKHQALHSLSVCPSRRFKRFYIYVFILMAILLLASCASMITQVNLPPVTGPPSGSIQEGRFVWIDLVTEDVVAAASFYSRLFGWRAAQSVVNAEYYLFYLDNKPVAGMTAMEDKDTAAPESLWLATMSVSDVDQSVALVKTHGGNVLEGPLDADGRGRMALVSDAADAPLILLRAVGDSPVGRKSKAGQWHWIDLITQDANRARTFYTTLFGYQVKSVEVGKEHQYDLFIQNKRAVAGLVELEWEGLEDNWLPYFKVNHVERSIENARSLGGKLILQSGDVAVLADPTGAAFAIQAP